MLLLISWAEFVTETAWLISVTIENAQDFAELIFLAAAARAIVAEMSEAVSLGARLADLWEARQRGGGGSGRS